MAGHIRQPPIFVVGSGRSGTTWVGDVLASCADCIPIFEPMRTASVAEVPRWGLQSGLPGPYLRAQGYHPEWAAFLADLLTGKISNSWTRQDWTRVPKLWTRWPPLERFGYRLAKIPYQYREKGAARFIIKEIRANLMLEWLECQDDVRIVYLVRHPCAVIGSRMRLGVTDWGADLGEILCQSQLMADFLEPFRPLIEKSTSLLRRQAILWCVENLVPIRQVATRDWLAFCYEEFVWEPGPAFEQLLRSLGLEPTGKTQRAKARLVSSPSPDFGALQPWHAPLSEHQGEEVLEACAEFGLDLYGRQRQPLCTLKETFDRLRLPARDPEALGPRAVVPEELRLAEG